MRYALIYSLLLCLPFSAKSANTCFVLLYPNKNLPPDSVVAQQTGRIYSSFKSKKILFGLKAGINVSNLNFNQGYPKPTVPVETSWRAGFEGGFLSEIFLSHSFSIQQEYLYSRMGGKITSSNTRYTLDYLSLPILFKYNVQKFALLAGPQFDLLIKSRAYIQGVSSTITHDTEERGIEAAAGVEYRPWQAVEIDVRYLQGLNHIGIGQRSMLTPREFKINSVQVAAGYRF